jgi:hypothetical protein
MIGYLSAFQPAINVFASILQLRYLTSHCGEIFLECREKGLKVVQQSDARLSRISEDCGLISPITYLNLIMKVYKVLCSFTVFEKALS